LQVFLFGEFEICSAFRNKSEGKISAFLQFSKNFEFIGKNCLLV
jgi:hypothetical protein